ncbi:MAG: hypothetical protein ABW189_05160 [Rickettsiales bacterium]
MKAIMLLSALLLPSCAAIQAQPGAFAFNETASFITARGPEEAARASVYLAEKVEQAETAGRAVKAASFCGEICAVSAAKSAYERDRYAIDHGVAFAENYCRASCGRPAPEKSAKKQEL